MLPTHGCVAKGILNCMIEMGKEKSAPGHDDDDYVRLTL
jgi:hypothetical protein